MRMGSVGFVQPFRYTLLLWATLFGFLAFAEVPDAPNPNPNPDPDPDPDPNPNPNPNPNQVPDAPTIIGSIILVAAGSCNVRLEQARGKTADALAAAQPAAAEPKPELGGARALV